MNLQEQISRIQSMMGLSESFEYRDILKLGSVGKEVEELQKLLGIYPPDGKFGKQTKKCVESFQSEMKIDDDGIVGSKTNEYLVKLQNKEITWDSPSFCKTETLPNSGNLKSDSKTQNEVPIQNTNFKSGIILMGGLDTRKSDKNISQQIQMVKRASNSENVVGFRYFDISNVINAIKKSPNSVVILFSAGCRYASDVASNLSDKTKLYIVEPYGISSNVKNSVQDAVSKGVPAKNVIVGPTDGRGLDIVSGASKTPSGLNHWDALEYVAKIVK